RQEAGVPLPRFADRRRDRRRDVMRHGSTESEEGFPSRARAVDSSCREHFLERTPIVRVPAGCQVLGLADGKAGMVKDDPGARAQIQQLEAHQRVDATAPVSNWVICDSSFMTPLACVTLSNSPASVSAS